MTSHDDFAFEPIPGLPERPPVGETILWQGSPRWRGLALRAFYIRPVLAYFAVLMAWRVWEGLSNGGSLLGAIVYALDLAPFLAAAVAVLGGLAWAFARSTIYTITSRRVVVRSGVALPMTVNIPFKLIDGASVKVHADGTGDIPLKLAKDAAISRLALWPNHRPWLLTSTEPMLRALRNPEAVARILGEALASSASTVAPGIRMPGLTSRPIRQDTPANDGELAGIATAARMGGALS
ncbi:MAG: photosynthetic complex putative assembly protein PuhB [Hyphomicrobiaceae bacterium]|nr:photosynthetic complex putative assembly protein PuhB [Hyphomicrobiaceae bacterium]